MMPSSRAGPSEVRDFLQRCSEVQGPEWDIRLRLDAMAGQASCLF